MSIVTPQLSKDSQTHCRN